MNKLTVFCLFALFALLFVGCPAETKCSQDSDCPQPGVCKEGNCAPTTAQESTDRVEKNTEQQQQPELTDAKELPPLPELGLKEQQLNKPEGLVESKQTDRGEQIRKLGETCDPAQGSLGKDSCGKDAICVGMRLSSLGLCMKTCTSTDVHACGTGEVCGPVYARENNELIGHACGKAVEDDYPCSHGFFCKKGSVCFSTGREQEGICKKTCKEHSECGNDGWCANVEDFHSKKDAFICKKLVKAKLGFCNSMNLCFQGLTCRGSSHDRKCLEDCLQSQKCPTGQRCIETKEDGHQVAFCYPVAKSGERCHSTLKCEKDNVCKTVGSNSYAHCLKDCGQDPKVCSAGESCVILGNHKVCSTVRKEGELCLRANEVCDTGLVCAYEKSGGAKRCLKACDADSKVCSTKQSCVETTYDDGTKKKFCFASCDKDKCTKTSDECTDIAGTKVCLFQTKTIVGTKKKNQPCHPFLGAVKELQCEKGLSCRNSAAGYRCLEPCDPKAKTCKNGEECLSVNGTSSHYCGVKKKEGDSCEFASSEICEEHARCQLAYGYSYGTCVTLGKRTKGQYCDSKWLGCGKGLHCSGSPLSPFRWRCLEGCDPTNPSCPNGFGCIKLNRDGACYPLCKSDSSCEQKGLQCKQIQNQKVCL